MELTAKELHAIYAPLWEKAPACKPDRLWYAPPGESGLPLEYGGVFEYWYKGYTLRNDLAAALCRVAVEDWLAEQMGCSGIEIHEYGQRYDDGKDGVHMGAVSVHWVGHGALGCSIEAGSLDTTPDGVKECWFDGLTTHHALVSAALAVAGEGEK